MNTGKILDIQSIRIKNVHFNPADLSENTTFPSINKAKAHSRQLGGANTVRAFRSKDEAYDFLRAYEKELNEEKADILVGQKEEFEMVAEAEEKANG